VTEIKHVPYVPLSHPFVERLIDTVRREYLDRTLFWTTTDLETKLLDFHDPLVGHDGRWLLYSRGRITDDIWLMNFGKGVNEGLHRRARVFPTPVEIPVVRCAVPLLNSLSWDVVKTFRQWPGDGNLEEPAGLRVDKQCSI
jgi:hypothetical protein